MVGPNRGGGHNDDGGGGGGYRQFLFSGEKGESYS